ncbi:MAG: DNA/RNA non-specific endonuclease, partial [Thermoanaerobaculia bacterium]
MENDPPAIAAFANPVTTVEQDSAPLAIALSGSDDEGVYNWSATAGLGVASAVVSSGQGTADVTYTVALQPGFNGTASFTARLSDNVNPAATATVTITVNAAPLPPVDHIVISQVYGGGGNSGATYRNDFVELFNPTTGAVDLGGWSLQYASASGTSWQVQILGGIMQPGEYYLIALGSNGAIGAALPEANVAGGLNLSATSGKVALSMALDPLDGCPIADANLVDLVGFGGANCREGLTNAPAPSNSTAIFRKSGGFADTNVNGADFETGAPNPRRTTPIQEIGPSVSSTDPRNDGVNAPRDASITVSFTEPVEVSGAWYGISCASSGRHDDATVATTGNSWIVTPNRNFEPGEQCTVTVYRLFVSDSDLDDGGPNDDHLRSDYTFSFTVATGTAPAYPADVHLTFGNPSGATADVLNPANVLMMKPEFALAYNRDRGTPNWVSWHLADEWVGTLTRVDSFRPDPAVPAEWYRVLHTDYSGSGFDRGHVVPSADRDKETSIPINQATFLMSNMIPQAPDNNQGPWANLENATRDFLYLLDADGRWMRDANDNPIFANTEVYLVAGGAGDGGTGSNGFASTIAGGKVAVPAFTWKVALVLPKLSGDDVVRVTAATRTIAVIMPNVQGIRGNDWKSYLTTVDAVEALTGYDLFANLPDWIETAVEAGTAGANPPAVDLSAPAAGVEGSALTASISVSDNASGSSTSTWSVTKDGSAFA